MTEVIKANIDKIQELQEICKVSYAIVFGNHWTDNGLDLYLEEQFNHTRLKSELVDDDFGYFFIRKDMKDIGFAKIKFKTSEEFSELDNCELEKIYILPDYSGSGIGMLVMNRIILKAKNRGKKQMYLYVIDTNLNAIAFYKKLGFVYHGKTRLEVPFFKEELRGMNRMVIDFKK